METTETPKIAGMYLVKSEETDNEWRPVIISHSGDGKLAVYCQDVGKHPVEVYHDGLINPVWKLIIE